MVKYISKMFNHSYVKNLNLKFDEEVVDFVINDRLFEELDLESYNDIDYDSLHNEAFAFIHELADARVEIYYYKIRQWAVDGTNWQYVEDAMDEGLTEGVTDYHKLIQIGQYYKIEQELRDNLCNLVEEIKDDAREYYEQQQIELEL